MGYSGGGKKKLGWIGRASGSLEHHGGSLISLHLLPFNFLDKSGSSGTMHSLFLD